ncbi:MAG: hypothetical protein EP338_11585 [Bacteroidetes bacterium]|nr:MAG: hypothetical protein EP338_11585 [Bacteroidota bacterium]
MKFEYPAFLYALLLLSIPIIIHLFNFRRYKVLYFSSLQFVRQLEEESKSTRKLKHLLVLISRLLAITFLVLAFAQPYIPLSSETDRGNAVLAIYVDNSFSMSQKGADGSLLSMAKEQARKLIDQAEPDSKFMVLTNNLEAFEQRLLTKENALDQLDRIDFSPLNKSMGEIVKWMNEGVQNAGEEGGQYIMLSDFQRNRFQLKTLPKDTLGMYYPIQLVPQVSENVSVDSIWFADPNFKIGVKNELNIRLKNHQNEELVNLELQLNVNETKRDVFVDLAPMEEKVVTINYTDQEAGIKKGLVRINDKQVHFDDDFYFSYEVSPSSGILIVDGEDAVPNISMVYRLDSYYQSEQVPLSALTSAAFRNKDLVVLNGWNRFSSGSAESLIRFVKNGGSLLVFPGKNLNFSEYNAFVSRLGGPKILRQGAKNTRIKWINYEDPFFKGMFDRRPDRLNMPSMKKAYETSGGNATFTELIRMQNGMPLLLRSDDPYRCYCFMGSLDESFGNFTANALFSSLLLRSAELSQRKYPVAVTIGEEAWFPIYKVPDNEVPVRLKSEELEFIPENKVENDKILIAVRKNSMNSNLKAGLFEVSKGEKLGYMALNYERSESDTRAMQKEELLTAFREQGIRQINYALFSDESRAGFIKLSKDREFWRLAILLAILFLLIEMALLKWMKA